MQLQTIENKPCGEKSNYPIQIRLSKTQKERLEFLAEQHGYKTISQYIRAQCLTPSIEGKLNQILTLLKNGGESSKE